MNMKARPPLDSVLELEPERYEFREPPRTPFTLDRRAFLRTLGGGLAVICLIRHAPAQESGRGGRRAGGDEAPEEIAAWLHIGADGSITACTGKVEVGQNARTSLSQAVADELRVPVESVSLIMADTDRVPFDRGTFGSRTTPTMAPQMRRAAASARELLAGLAAERFGVDRRELEVAEGQVAHRSSGRSITFGDLTAGRELVETIDGEPTAPEDWTASGRTVPKVNGRNFVTGRHRYASDHTRPDLLHAKILRAPSFGASLASLDASAAEAMPDVVFVRDGAFVGVAAMDESTADRALAAIRAEWDEASDARPSDTTLSEYFKQNAKSSEPDDESIASALEVANAKVEASYSIAYIAHAPLEPRAAVAEWEGDRLTVWTGTSRPFGVRTELAQAFQMPEDRIRVIVPDTGSGYGGKHTGDAAVEAARLAKAAGKPVKLVWTREEEFTWAYLRPGGLIEAKAGVAQDGTVLAWEFHNHNSGGSGLETPYEVRAQRHAFHAVESPLRQGSYRALASTANNFARESIMDELAAAIGMDPLAFRLKNLRNDRLRAVLEAAADQFGWGKSETEADRGCGLACGSEKGGYVATCAEVAIDRGRGRPQPRVLRVVAAFECGAIVNPDHLQNQVEGCLVQGLGGALFERVRFANGRIRNPRFTRYPLPRFRDTPSIEVVLIDRHDLPSAGAGETPIVAIAPAVGNAIFAATGKRVRSLPMVPEGLQL